MVKGVNAHSGGKSAVGIKFLCLKLILKINKQQEGEGGMEVLFGIDLFVRGFPAL